jgi:hypothetical protein
MELSLSLIAHLRAFSSALKIRILGHDSNNFGEFVIYSIGRKHNQIYFSLC